ncbi:acyl-CoA dehydrogenase family protein [Halobellus salinisoli]|uniref:acyl-CoA dehydrogenase family protein n=1 Tax=Halobellus salinisoli TaxID=3108500 RepID=UPI003009977B
MELLTDVGLPEEAKQIKREAREFAQEYIAPNAAEYFNSGKYPHELVDPAVEAGFVGKGISEEYGGRGTSLIEDIAVHEEFFRADAGLSMALLGRAFGASMIELFGTDEQKDRYLPPIPSGEEFSGGAISEPETGSDLTGMETAAERDGDEWIITGEKYWIGNGVDADWVVVYAKTGDGENPYENYSLIIVPTDVDGYDAEEIPAKMSMRASQQAHIVFDDCRVPTENLLGDEGEGFRMLTEFFNEGRISVAAHGVGLAAAAVEEAWAFVHDREEFGKTVSDFQSVQHDLADMRLEFESARAMTWRAARMAEADVDDASAWAAMAKVKATEVAAECAQTGVKLHGGRGILNDRRITRVYRDVRAPMIYEGVNDIQRDLIYKQSK